MRHFFHLLFFVLITGSAACGDSATQIKHHDRTYFYRCSDSFEFVARFEKSAVWVFWPGGSAELPFIDSRRKNAQVYRGDNVVFFFKGREASLQENGTFYRDCRNDRRRAVWEDAKLNGIDFRAVGNEPPWILEIRGERLDFYFGYEKKLYRFRAKPQTDPLEPRTVFESKTANLPFKVILRPGPCSDTMADEIYETSVEIFFNDRHLHGCGMALH
ncbi:hypothetical protein [Hydrogenimonas sp.]|uniref:hypothetical protein n=1 Tax=Hydrogenimonas sp. TaxID=2231112 RepID=UPI002624C3D2|nr:hypothetical protein [Hydrogenimonas sp.]